MLVEVREGEGSGRERVRDRGNGRWTRERMYRINYKEVRGGDT